MVQPVRMPMMGNTMERGLLVEWEAAEGDEVAEGDVVVVVESEKAAGEVQASQDGTLARVDVKAGEEVPPGTVLGVVLGPDESLDDAPAPRSLDPESEGDGTVDADGDPSPSEASEPVTTGDATAESDDTAIRASPDARKATVSSERDFTSPTTRRLARELGVSLDDIEGTGIGDRVTESDVRAAAGQVSLPATAEGRTESTPSSAESTTTDAERVGATVTAKRTISGMRKTIADRMSRSARQAPHVTLKRDVDVERVFETAEELSSEADVSIGFTDLLVGASVRALDAHPAFNAWLENDTIRLVAERNVAIAVDVDAGLVTPVIRSADERTLASIAAERSRLTDAVLDGEYTMDDLKGGTFTISNLGMFGVDSFDPIIDPPQVAILGVGRVRDDGDGRTCTLSLSFDHRVSDGADAARFLDDLVAGIEAPSLVVADRSAVGGDAEGFTETGQSGVAEASTREKGVAEAVAQDIEATARDIAAAHDWPVPSLEVRLADGRPSVTVYAPADASQATMKRLTYAACRDSAYAQTIAGIRNPEITVR